MKKSKKFLRSLCTTSAILFLCALFSCSHGSVDSPNTNLDNTSGDNSSNNNSSNNNGESSNNNSGNNSGGGGGGTTSDYSDDSDINHENNPDDYRQNNNDYKNWNLANVHDPTVAKWTDDYYYMYQTDASFGNVHETISDLKGGHFYCRRSKDLVKWEAVGMALSPTLSDTIKEGIRTQMNKIRKNCYSQTKLDEIAKADVSWLYWAPVVRKITVDGTTKFRMYACIGADNKLHPNAKDTWVERAFIVCLESTNPAQSSWDYKGIVLCSSTAEGDAITGSAYSCYYFNAIDPTYTVTASGEHWMTYGSWHHGFATVQIDPKTGLVLDTTNNIGRTFDADNFATAATAQKSYMGSPVTTSVDALKTNGYGERVYCRGANTASWQPSEGPEIIYNSKTNKYYLFVANGQLSVAYHTRLLSAENPRGTWTDILGRSSINGGNGTSQNILPVVTAPYRFKGNQGWVGISHCAIFEGDSGEFFFASQGRFPADYDTWSPNAVMMGQVRKIVWAPKNSSSLNELWPLPLPERYTNVSNKSAITESEIAGAWEIILLDKTSNDDKSTEINKSEYLYLSADKKMSGAYSGTWEFDGANKYLKLTGQFPAKAGETESRTVVLCLEREKDWEAIPQTETIVFAGYDAWGNAADAKCHTYWGKKIAKAVSYEVSICPKDAAETKQQLDFIGAATTKTDSAGTENVLSFPGKKNGEGSASYVKLSSGALKDVDFSNGLTVSMNIYATAATASDWYYVFSIGSLGEENNNNHYIDGTVGFIARLESNEKNIAYTPNFPGEHWDAGNTVGSAYDYFASGKAGNGAWHKYEFVYNASEIATYVDGKKATTWTAPNEFLSAVNGKIKEGEVHFGAGVNPDLENFGGYMKDIKIYNYDIYASQN